LGCRLNGVHGVGLVFAGIDSCRLATQASPILLRLLIPSSGSGKVADREFMSFP
jgi:hypothetical protein